MQNNQSRQSRRGFFMGTATLGAAVATASVLPQIQAPAAAIAKAPLPPEKGGGYYLSEHVKRYYKTTYL